MHQLCFSGLNNRFLRVLGGLRVRRSGTNLAIYPETMEFVITYPHVNARKIEVYLQRFLLSLSCGKRMLTCKFCFSSGNRWLVHARVATDNTFNYEPHICGGIQR